LRMEAFLDQTGDLDLDESGGPTGYAGARLVNALATYQKRNDLTPDGLANPDGPTVKQMARDERERPLPNPDYPWRGSY
ncbi:peptidoglycan-binding protein, partial [bacterium LRH843]|nr:peptidoglycan-binding protein [bacterium LRH843]